MERRAESEGHLVRDKIKTSHGEGKGKYWEGVGGSSVKKLVFYQQHLKGKESAYDPHDVTDHPKGAGKLPEKERFGGEFMVPCKSHKPDLGCVSVDKLKDP